MKKLNNDVEAARAKWLAASERASQLSAELLQPGSGYGDPNARSDDEHRLQSARHDVERFFQEYHDLDRRDIELKMLELQRSQRLATWASFAVAVVVGLATVVSTWVSLKEKNSHFPLSYETTAFGNSFCGMERKEPRSE